MTAEAYLAKLTEALSRLPGVGRRSAGRMAERLAREKDGLARELMHSLAGVCENVTYCSQCGALTSYERIPCRLCTDPDRESGVLCVVEDPGDISVLERAGCMRGRYHALLGRISPMRGTGPDDLRIRQLLERVETEKISEVVLALNTNVESDATAVYVGTRLRDKGVKVTRLAFGIPAGSGIVYADPVTLQRAFRGRQGIGD